jgi:hypothetical protein
VIVGLVLSMFSVTLVLAVWPAASVALPLMTWFAPSVLTICGAGQLIGGTPPLQVKVTVTLVLFQLAALAGGAAVAVTTSGVSSTLKVSVALAEFPARSVAVPLNVWFKPAVVTEIGGGQTATPDSASEHVNVTVAGARTTPPTGKGDTATVIVGLVLSIFSVTLALAVWPAASVALPLMT